ncbi:integrase, catalytic region, zinc finger, CCHC-type containing protein [Tanacetum coccineum]
MHNNCKGKKQQVEDHRLKCTYGCSPIAYSLGKPFRNAKPNLFDQQPLEKTVVENPTNSKTRSTIRNQYGMISIGHVNGGILVEIILFIVDSGYSKHMTENLKLLSNFVEQFLGLNHNLFFVGQFCDADSEVAFRKSTCYIRDLKGNDLLIGSRGTDLYSVTLQDTSTPNPICLMAKASSSHAWLWYHRLSHLNFDTINLLSKYDIVTGLPKLKFVKDHLCSSCTKCLNKTIHVYFAQEGIEHQTSIARTPKQNGVVEKRNCTLVEAARTMLSAAKVPLFFWAEAIATICFTQNRSLVIPRHEKTPYHIIIGQKSSVKFFHIFGSLCYIVRDGENLDKMKEKSDHISSNPAPQSETVTTSNELDLIFSLMFNELLNGTTQVVSKSSAVTTVDAPNQRQQQHITLCTSTTVAADTSLLNIQTTSKTTSQPPTHALIVTANKNIIQTESNKEYAQVDEDEFINIFSTPVQE